MTAISKIQDLVGRLFDAEAAAQRVIDTVHENIHEAKGFFVSYSVPSLGAMTSPNDMITLTFTTPDTTKWPHLQFEAKGTAGWRVRLIEAPTGGGETQTEQLEIFNNNRNSVDVSGLIALDDTPGEVSYDATLVTGGKILFDEYIQGPGGPFASASSLGSRDEIMLKQNTKYQLSLFGTDTDPATLKMLWYEHTNL